MTEPKLPDEPTSTSQDVLVSHEYIDYVSALREAAEKALALAAEREWEIEGLKKRSSVVDAIIERNGDAALDAMNQIDRDDALLQRDHWKSRAEAANARAEAAEANDRRYRYLRPMVSRWASGLFIGQQSATGISQLTDEEADAAIDAMVRP